MAKDKKLKASKNKVVEDKVVTQSQSTSSTTEKKTKDSKKQDTPPPDDENSQSPVTDEEEREVDDEEDDDDEKEDGDEEDDEDKKADHLSWPKSDDLELFKQIRKACPKGDTMRYSSRVNNLDWELVQFQDYSADQCKNRWLHIQAHLRHYRILSDLLEDALSWVDNPWYNFNKGAKNDQKHPEQPKKPLSSYMLFFIEQKEAVMEEQPYLGMAQVSQIIGQMYNDLSDQKKTEYSKKAKKEKEDYQEKMKKFKDAHPDYVPPKSKNAKAVAPRPPTPFNLFSDEKMEELLAEGVSLSETKERCRDAYKELKDIEKLTWIHRAMEKERDYNEEFKKFQLKNPEVSAKQPSLLTKEELRIKNESMGKPIKPPHCGYGLFCKYGLSKKKIMADLGPQWNNLSSKKKASYNLKATEMNNAYRKRLASYNSRLTLQQPRAELMGSQGQKRKRTAAGQKGGPMVKKSKSSAAADAGSSESERDYNGASDEDFEIPPKTAIQKARKVNGRTVQKSINEMPSTSKKSSASTSSKAAAKSTATSLTSSERDSSSKKSAGNSDSKSLKLSPKTKAASSVKSSEKPKTPVWAANQELFKAVPPKPPKSVAAFYVKKHHPEAGNLSSAEINLLWIKVSEKQKKKLMAEYEKMRGDYEQKFESFVRTLKKDELEAFRVFIKKREQNDEDGEDDSYGSTDEGDGSSEGSDEDSEPNGSNEVQRPSGGTSNENIRILYESINLE